MTKTEDAAERAALAATPGLTRFQRESILDPSFSLRAARVVLEALKLQAAKYAAKPEAEKALDRAAGLTSIDSNGVTNDGAKMVLGSQIEVEAHRG